jgi:hypothetical protein
VVSAGVVVHFDADLMFPELLYSPFATPKESSWLRSQGAWRWLVGRSAAVDDSQPVQLCSFQRVYFCCGCAPREILLGLFCVLNQCWVDIVNGRFIHLEINANVSGPEIACNA